MEIKYELLQGGIRFVSPISIFYVPFELFLPFQQKVKEAIFDYYSLNKVRLGDVGDKKEGER